MKEKVSAGQARAFVIAAGIGTIFLYIGTLTIPVAGSDAWLSYVVGYSLATLNAFALISLSMRFPGKTFVQYAVLILGRPLGKLLGLVYILTFTYYSALLLALHNELIVISFLQQTPRLVLVGSLALLVVYIAKAGIEVFGRVCEILTPWVAGSLVLTGLLLIPEMDWSAMLPVAAEGPTPILRALPQTFSFASEFVLFMAAWLPFLNRPRAAYRAVVVGVPISLLALLTILIASITVFGTDTAGRLTFGAWALAAYVSLGEFLERMQSVILSSWVAASFMKATVFFLPAVMGLAQWLGLREYRFLVWPMGLLVTFLALLPQTYGDLLTENAILSHYFVLPTALSIPILWIVATLRRMGHPS